MFGMLSKCSDCLHLACHSHSCSKSLERVGSSSKSFQQVRKAAGAITIGGGALQRDWKGLGVVGTFIGGSV